MEIGIWGRMFVKTLERVVREDLIEKMTFE